MTVYLNIINGTNGDDVLTGTNSHDTMNGLGGNDQIFGGLGVDRISGGAGSDTVNGGEDADTLYSDLESGYLYPLTVPYISNQVFPVLDRVAEVDTLYGGAGDDVLFGGYGDTIDGGDGANVLYLSLIGAPGGLTINFSDLNGGIASAGYVEIGGGLITNIARIEWVEGTNFDDVFEAGNNSVSIYGMGGNDYMLSSPYTWLMRGGDGNDTLDATLNAGVAYIFGDAGDDIITSVGASAYGGDGNDSIQSNGPVSGEGGDDTLFGVAASGGTGNDIIYMRDAGYMAIPTKGDDGDDIIYAPTELSQTGSPHDFYLVGGNGADWLIGSPGSDILASGNNDNFTTTILDDTGTEHDRLEGRDGDDIIYAGIGDDVDGGTGTNDRLNLNLAGATSAITLDTSNFQSGATVFGGLIQNIEAILTIKGSAFSDTINATIQSSTLTVYGGAGDDVASSTGSMVIFYGEEGNDTFLSGGASDHFYGGAGTDTVSYADSAMSALVTLNLIDAGAGSGANGDLLFNIENVIGTGFSDALTGNNFANLLVGGGGNDVIVARAGDDTLIGGSGDDDLRGGTGNDAYYVDTGDTITELAGQGADSLYASASFALSAGQSIETLSTTNAAGTAAINLFGNDLANTITGNAGANILYGYDADDVLQGLDDNDVLVGGNGNDRMEGGNGTNELIGGGGDDTYVIINRIDTTYELASEGSDTVETTLPIYQLQSNVENLTLTDSAAHGAAVGNALGNIITGNSGVDDLFGREGNDILRGGTGAANTLLGQEGDDIYIVETAGDTVLEFANEGDDTVQTALSSFTLRDHVENLIFTGAGPFTGIGAAGTNRITGGGSNDFLSGLDGNDTLTGAGGNDELFGGTGADTFRFQGGDGIDRIYDFTSGSDKIGFVSWLFTVTGTLTLVQSNAPTSTTSNTSILYNSSTGLLSYDLDGTGGIGAVPLAYLNTGLTLSLADFVYY